MQKKLLIIFKNTIKICIDENINYWVVGGFAVDAKKGFISREHGDIDLCIHQNDIQRCLKSFYKHGYKITREGLKFVFYKSNVKIDIFELFENGNYYTRKREWFNAKYPKEMFDNFQMLKLEGIKFKIPSNEGLRYYGKKTRHQEDTNFINSLPFDENIFSKIEYNEFANYNESIKDIKTEELLFNE